MRAAVSRKDNPAVTEEGEFAAGTGSWAKSLGSTLKVQDGWKDFGFLMQRPHQVDSSGGTTL